ncbi:hypothetical protein NDU88_004080 [Pleurodeles waltl]|uniref:Uncharacterized protein n=1 Tax=Pleurodeles waltl TaxID=8319 RepID=A0AAV7NK15_PLEWA|nr:hypothetical protein NDU88_004080 [Pleurodeles waltl]
MSSRVRNRSKVQARKHMGDSAGGAMAEPVTPPLQATLDKILEAIEDSKTTLQWDIGQVSVKVNLLRADHQKLADRVKENEIVLAEISPVQQEVKATVLQLTESVQ